jgi:hypothetical protein
MADTDGRDLAKYFYASVFSDEMQGGMTHYERTVEALRDAVMKLRRKGGTTLERFVHYGACRRSRTSSGSLVCDKGPLGDSE